MHWVPSFNVIMSVGLMLLQPLALKCSIGVDVALTNKYPNVPYVPIVGYLPMYMYLICVSSCKCHSTVASVLPLPVSHAIYIYIYILFIYIYIYIYIHIYMYTCVYYMNIHRPPWGSSSVCEIALWSLIS